MRRVPIVGLTVRVPAPVREALLQIVQLQRTGETASERKQPSDKEVLGDILTSYVTDSFSDVFAGISWLEYCRLRRKGVRIRLRRYARQ